ncbi:MAG: glycosyltransferase [Gemmatimonadota bacterium]
MPLVPDLSVIVPCYNEGDRLADTFDAIRDFASQTTKFEGGIEWIFVDDGSTDATFALIEEHAATNPTARGVRLPANAGKGAAVVAGDRVARAPIRAFTDCDLATPLRSLEQLPRLFREFSADLVIGSRHTPWSRLIRPQPPLRRLAGRLFSFVMAHFHRSAFTDTQCGFKAWNRDFSRSVVQRLGESGWSFDLEMIGRAESRRARILELPVAWTDKEGSKVHAAVDGPRMLRDGMEFWLRYTPRLLLGLGLLVAVIFVFQGLDWPNDVKVYHEAWTNAALRRFDAIYTPGRNGQGGFYDSPLFAMLGAPLSHLPPRTAALLYIVVQGGLLGASLVLLKRWTRYQIGETSLGVVFWLTFLLAFLNTALGQFHQGNLSLPIFLLCLMSGYSYLFGHRALSAGWLALAINIKVFPAFLIGFALLRRDWRFCAWLAGILLLLVLTPALYFGWDVNLQLHGEFLSVLSGYGSENDRARVVYQSLPTAFYRIALGLGEPSALNALRAGQLLVVAAAIWVWWAFRRRLRTDWILVYSFFLALTAQFLPYSRIPSMGFFYAPLALITMHGWASRTRWPYSASLVGFLLLYSFSTEFILGRRLNDALEYASIPTLGIWILLVGAFVYWTRGSESGSRPASHFPALPDFTPRQKSRREETHLSASISQSAIASRSSGRGNW